MEVKQIPLSLVTPSPMNPRKTFDEAALQELADNIEKQGLLQPITVRPIKGPRTFAVIEGNADFHPQYEIVCGERRYRAFSILCEKWNAIGNIDSESNPYNNFTEITAIVREMTDEEAFEAMITENLQRRDVDPIEEAFAFAQLIKAGKTAEDIALKFGKSVRFIQDRVKLNSLIPELMLALKDEKMSISAAMLISKLDGETQRKFFSQYQYNSQGFSKHNAENFVNSFFMTIDKSLWYQSDNQAKEDFDGGCNTKCSACSLNTANHGCLFWEMKTQDAGRCTNREKFQLKTIAFMLSEIDKMGDNLVKKNQPLTKGKTVLFIADEPYDSDDVKELKKKVRAEIDKRGLEIVDKSMFRSQCYYDNDDERITQFLNNGEIYPCIELFDWRNPTLNLKYWYLLKGDTSTNSDEQGVPFQVNKILKDVKNEEDSIAASLTVARAEALNNCTPSVESLNDDETILLLTCMLANNYNLCSRVGMTATSDTTDSRNIMKWVGKHREKWADIQLVWMFQQINGEHAKLRAAESMLDTLREKYCPDTYKDATDKVNTKFEKYKAKAEKKLKELGYGLDGNPITEKQEDTTKISDILKKVEQTKKKNPSAIVFHETEKEYRCFGHDAATISLVIGLSMKTITVNGKQIDVVAIPKSEFDKYLKQMIREGYKVALC